MTNCLFLKSSILKTVGEFGLTCTVCQNQNCIWSEKIPTFYPVTFYFPLIFKFSSRKTSRKVISYLEGRDKLCLRLTQDGDFEIGIDHQRVNGAAIIMNMICRNVKLLDGATIFPNPAVIFC